MATVDTEIRFNKFNSLRLEKDEVSWSTKFEVEFYSVLTVQAQVLCLDGSATGQFILRWLDEDGKKVIDSTDAFSIDNRWKRKTATFEVPEGAVQCMFALKNADATKSINVACAMVEAGEIASAFDPSLASQTALLDAHGLYVGTVSAYQVIAGILQSLDMRAYFDLEKPEIVMKGDDAVWCASPKNPLRLEDTDGNFLGGLVKQGRDVFLASSGLATNENPVYTMKIGDVIYLDESEGAGLYTFEKSRTDEPVVAIETMGTVSEGMFSIKTNHSVLMMSDGEILPAQFFIKFQDGNNHFEFAMDPIYGTWLIVGDNSYEISLTGDSSGFEITHSGAKLNGLGADSTSPYYIVNGTKKRLT